MQSSALPARTRTRAAPKTPRLAASPAQPKISTDDPPLLIRDRNGKILAGIKLEAQEITQTHVHLRGWCFGWVGVNLVLDGEPIHAGIRTAGRRDVADTFKLPANQAIGFEIRREYPPGGNYSLGWGPSGNLSETIFMLGDVEAGVNEKPELLSLLKARNYAELVRQSLGSTAAAAVHLHTAEVESRSFRSLSDFYSHLAQSILSKGTLQTEDRRIARHLMEVAIATGRRIRVDAHVAHLENLATLNDSSELIRAIGRAVCEPKTDPRLLWAAAVTSFRSGDPAAARLLVAHLFQVAPTFANTQSNSKVIWDTIVEIHDEADRQGLKKLGTLQKWLASVGVESRPPARPDSDAPADHFQEWHQEVMKALDGRDAGLLIDSAHYSTQVGKGFADPVDALVDYLHIEWRSGRNVIASLDNTFVRAQLRARGVDTTAAPLLILFLRYEAEFNLSPHPLFDPGLYPNHAIDGASGSKWLHYIYGGWRLHSNPSQYFDLEFFRVRLGPNTGTDAWPPILRYLAKHPTSDANRRLHSAFYLHKYGPYLQGRPPLVHYVADGAYLGYKPNPFFEPAGIPLEDRLAYVRLS